MPTWLGGSGVPGEHLECFVFGMSPEASKHGFCGVWTVFVFFTLLTSEHVAREQFLVALPRLVAIPEYSNCIAELIELFQML